MRRRPLLWLSVSILCFVAAFYSWRLGDKWAAQKAAASHPAGTNQAKPGDSATNPVASRLQGTPVAPLNRGALTNSPANRLAYRLSNTTNKVGQLARNPKAILLENALLDTAQSTQLPIPNHLRAQGDPGTYIVQSRQPLDNAFRSLLQQAGANIVAYIPNNAYLVRASQGVAQSLAARPQIQTVLPYEPYYKLKASLLQLAVEQKPLADSTALNLLLFADAREATLKSLEQLGAQVVSEERSPFGPVLKVQPPVKGLAALAGLSGVQVVERASARRLANDLSRATIGVAADSVTPDNYLGLTGTNVLININDTGVDATHPDLITRVLLDPLDTNGVGAFDTSGHGTHVAGIIAGDGSKSTTVSTNAFGSIVPTVAGQFRGKAPGAKLFSLPWSAADSYLQETAARTNAFVSNNSWTYGDNEYSIAAASYDAAVRDALPTNSHSQPMVYVFPAGNGGTLNRPDGNFLDAGVDGTADGILAPGTAKNVITVGGTEQLRGITNEVERIISGIKVTNTPWAPKTDSTNQVAGFSRRGNVGVEIEGDSGRFKPDVVAPGAFVISTRSSMWDEDNYYNPTNYHFNSFSDVVNPGELRPFAIYVPENSVQLIIRASAAVPLPIYVKQSDIAGPAGYDVMGTNIVSLPPDLALSPVGVDWFFSIGSSTNLPVIYNWTTELITTNDYGNYLEVLSNLNNSISGTAPHAYRYESGTSMAAADVAGTLGLMQEFFEQRMHQTNSPALMKALLINGARSLGRPYDYQVRKTKNYQGWGQVQLPTTIYSNLLTTAGTASRPTFLFDQNPTNALATGQSQTRFVTLSPEGRHQTLRATLVWTDPPGNPVASIKLVNDLDLIVTNLDTGAVYYGNDIPGDTDFSLPWDTNGLPNIDVVNNVENVYLQDPLGTNYSITVVARHVNVNAVSAHPDDVVQDYALVISSGDGGVPDALTVTDRPIISTLSPYVTIVTNSFPSSSDSPTSGGILLNQHVGANTPLLGTNQVPLGGANISGAANGVLTLGMPNQWHFYVLSNDFNYTNAAFVTFMPPNLAVPRMGVNVADPDNATRLEADIDLYVSMDYNLTNLSPTAIANARKSLSRGGTEVIAISDAAPAGVYYVGVKSEDQQAAEYGFLGIFSLYPFSTSDENGNQYLRGLPTPSLIPNGTLAKPVAATVFGIGIMPVSVRRVIVTNAVTHESMGDLVGVLTHNHKYATLNNHSCVADPADPNRCLISHAYIYEDNGEGNVLDSKPCDGPGTLKNFIGEQGIGLWQFSMVNSSQTFTGQVDRLQIKLEPQNLD
ncbi:MAG TPA: S8 family serine peptidase, partial [Bacillota bacterium]|nr:S8 family serine peptidase [Bacillota bacterium]